LFSKIFYVYSIYNFIAIAESLQQKPIDSYKDLPFSVASRLISVNFRDFASSIRSSSILVLAFAFGLSAEIERNLISERTKAGLARAVKEGKRLGRPKGRKPSRYKLTGKGGIIRRARLEGKSKSEIARNLCVTWVTLDRYMKRLKI